MRVILKIIAAPFVAVLTIAVAVLWFLFCCAVGVMYVVSMILVLVGVVTLITHQTLNGCIILFIAFLASPFGLPAIAEWLIDRVNDLNYSLRDFITS